MSKLLEDTASESNEVHWQLNLELLSDTLQLTCELEAAYLSGRRYKLSFPTAHLPKVEKIFDDIIGRHGLKNSCFTYNLDN